MIKSELREVRNGSERSSLHLRRSIFLVRQENDVLSLHALCCPPENSSADQIRFDLDDAVIIASTKSILYHRVVKKLGQDEGDPICIGILIV